jgi:hypothetical protein
MKNWRQILSWRVDPKNPELKEGDKVIFIGSDEDYTNVDLDGIGDLLDDQVGEIWGVFPDADWMGSDPEFRGVVKVRVNGEKILFPYSYWRKYLQVLD